MIEIKSKLDLQELIKNSVTEDLNLEYKSSPSLSKDDKKKTEFATV